MRLPLLALLASLALPAAATVGCGQIAPTDAEKRGSTPPDPSSSAAPGDPAGSAGSAAPPGMVPPSGPTPTAPPAAGTCGAMLSPRSFPTPDARAVALHGLWVTCTSDPAPGLCPPSDSSMFFGALDAQSDPTSRAAACGHLTSHGDGFIVNAAYAFTYEVNDLAPSGSPPTYLLHVWNMTADRTFVLTYRDDAASGFVSEETITLGEPDARVGTLRHSAFTTF